MGKRGERMKEGEGRRIEEESKNGMGKRGRENERCSVQTPAVRPCRLRIGWRNDHI